MAEFEPNTDTETIEPPVQAEDLLGLNPDLARSVALALDDGDEQAVKSLVDPLHYAEIANLLEQLPPDLRRELVEHQRPNFDPEILPELDENVRNEVAEILGTNSLSSAISKLESDDALSLLSTLEDSKRKSVMEVLPAQTRAALRISDCGLWESADDGAYEQAPAQMESMPLSVLPWLAAI